MSTPAADATREAVAEVDIRVPDRVCCRRESARTGATLRAAETALSGAQTELVSVKRRLRQYAATLDAVSVHAKEEIGVALSARNAALAASATSAAERDALGTKSESLNAALAAARAEHADLKRRHALVDQALTKSVEEVARLRREFERAKRSANEYSNNAAVLQREKTALSSELSQLRMNRRAVIEERDDAVDALQDAKTELVATKRELALVRHELATRAPPEISQNVRKDIAEGAAAAVERRTMAMIRAVAGHYVNFGLDRPEYIEKKGIPGDETEEDIPEEEIEAMENMEREIPSPLTFANGQPGEEIVSEEVVDDEEKEEVEPELPDANDVLEKHMQSISQITSTADAEATPIPPAEHAPSTAVVEEGPVPVEDEPEQIARPTDPDSPVTPAVKDIQTHPDDLLQDAGDVPPTEEVSRGLDLPAEPAADEPTSPIDDNTIAAVAAAAVAAVDAVEVAKAGEEAEKTAVVAAAAIAAVGAVQEVKAGVEDEQGAEETPVTEEAAEEAETETVEAPVTEEAVDERGAVDEREAETVEAQMEEPAEEIAEEIGQEEPDVQGGPEEKEPTAEELFAEETAAPAPEEEVHEEYSSAPGADHDIPAEAAEPVQETSAPQPPQPVTMDDPDVEAKAPGDLLDDPPADVTTPLMETPGTHVTDGDAEPFLQEKQLDGSEQTLEQSAVAPAYDVGEDVEEEAHDVVDESHLAEVEETVEEIETEVQKEDPVHIPVPDQTLVDTPVEENEPAVQEGVPSAAHVPVMPRPVEVGPDGSGNFQR